jgi:hypothetical protein
VQYTLGAATAVEIEISRPAILSLLWLFALSAVSPGDAIARTQVAPAGAIADFFIEA